MPGYELVGDEELESIKKIFKEGNGVLFRQGFENLRGASWCVKNFEAEFAKEFGSQDALAVSSGTAALRVALAAVGIGRGDEVITQAFTFVATVEAIVESGAVPIITEIDDSLNMSPVSLQAKITKKTKAVIVVHMLGTPANMDEIVAVCKTNNIILIEDTAWGCGGSYKGKLLGTIGDIGCFSFDFAKAITTGEGGMVISGNREIMAKARAFHDHGHENNPTLARWEDSRSSGGFNFRMSELQGAVGIAQLFKLSEIIRSQRENAQVILDVFKIFGTSLKVLPRHSPNGSLETFDAVVLRCSNKTLPQEIRSALLKVGLSTKILPEATTWHFAGDWSHMGPIKQQIQKNKDFLDESRDILSHHIAIPNYCRIPETFTSNLTKAIKSLHR